MEAYQQRVVEEKSELDAKIQRLGEFVSSARFVALPPSEQERMARQCQIMRSYSDVLGERIAAF